MRYFAVLIPLFLGFGLYAAAEELPALASKEMLLGVASFFALAWGGLAFALPKLSDLLALEGITSSQREILVENVRRARQKIWRIGGTSLLCVMVLFFLSVVTRPEYAQIIAGFAGVASGFAVELMFAYRRWHDEIHDFTTTVNQKRLDMKAKADALSRLANSS
ncbi:MAG: hypothetical protein ACO1PN_15885 [Betaproteobacteria bacterium]